LARSVMISFAAEVANFLIQPLALPRRPRSLSLAFLRNPQSTVSSLFNLRLCFAAWPVKTAAAAGAGAARAGAARAGAAGAGAARAAAAPPAAAVAGADLRFRGGPRAAAAAAAYDG